MNKYKQKSDTVVRKTYEYLRKHDLFQAFSDIELEKLAQLFKERRYQPEELIIEEDTLTNELFFLSKGSVDIVKNENNKEHALAEISEEGLFGEMSFFDMKERSTSVKAKTKVEVFSFAKEDLDKLSGEFDYLKYKFPLQVCQMTVERLRKANQEILTEIDLRHRFSKFLLTIVLGLFMVVCVTGFIKTIHNYLPLHFVSVILGVCSIALCRMIVTTINQPLKNLGLTLCGWRKSTLEGVVISLLLIAIFQLVFPEKKLLAVTISLFEGHRGILYLFVAFLQEFIFRGVFQTALSKFYQDKNNYLSIFICSLIFAASHIYIGFSITIASFVAGILFSVVYIRHQSLFGVTIIHFILGCMAVALGFLGHK